MRATDRALPWPLAAPISARRHASVHATDASGAGPVNVLTITLSGSSVARSIGSGGGGTTFETRWSCSGASPMWKSAPSGPAISLAKNWPSESPVMRRTTSPTRWPWFSAW